MRGGVARWKRGVAGHGLRAAVHYAFDGVCDGARADRLASVDAAIGYAHAGSTVTRFTATEAGIAADELGVEQLKAWVAGSDPATGVHRGYQMQGPDADLLFDATVNAPKTLSLAAMLDPEIAAAFDALQERIRDRTIDMWRTELNARRGAQGRISMDLAQIEVVELKHARSRSLDPHTHTHMWLNARALGQDGRWSNLDSRTMLRFQTLVNAEGQLAAVTDTEWVATLAAKGFTIDPATGEVEQLQHLVRAFSKRSNQIESAKARFLAEWQAGHPGQEPTVNDQMAIDRRAWAVGRPEKPDMVSEEDWVDGVRRELTDLDPALLKQRKPVTPPVTDRVVRVSGADIDRVARLAIADADSRSTSSSGRFSDYTLRAGAVRAVARVVASGDRDVLASAVDAALDRARGHYLIDLAADSIDVPGEVGRYMLAETATLKRDVDEGMRAQAKRGKNVATGVIEKLASNPKIGGEHGLDEQQTAAACAIAGSSRLVTVIGPAGAGKTTMLKVARASLSGQGRKVLIVAPTKKASSVAGRETGADATSLHALLFQYGFRWTADEDTGRPAWQRLAIGQKDPMSKDGHVYRGPKDSAVVDRKTRIVVDEAGMVDLHTMHALLQVTAETGAGIALVGDPAQVNPVGHTGAMALGQRYADTHIDLESVHRFRTSNGETDTAYANLTLRMRSGDGPDEVAHELVTTGHVRTAATMTELQAAMRDRYLELAGHKDRAALCVATNEEAVTLNDLIQEERIVRGHVTGKVLASTTDGAVIYAGDVVQTRQNDSDQNVENRQVWTVRKKTLTGKLLLESVDQKGLTTTVDADYAADRLALAYASTIHGIQGETVHGSIVGPGVDAAGLYVGLTRGKRVNEAFLVASDDATAERQLVESLRRGDLEASLQDNYRALHRELGISAREGVFAPAPWQQRPAGHLLDLDATEAQISPAHTHDELQTIKDDADRLEDELRKLRLARNDANADPRRGDGPAVEEIDALQIQANAARVLEREATKASMPELRNLDAIQAERVTRTQLLAPDVANREHEERVSHARRDRTRRPIDVHAVQPGGRAREPRERSAAGLSL
ncbi:AAA family ATPase [Pseudoclavibacter sp. AY1H1]|uniref:AAA family ATPase n=1 Tax=Pseudoclavibacter sp. AY1H1 TaxID=2080584 RepID=UPI0015E46A6B|nr:AAA family ATPase [Pseudoclavibacter sp. AY1H1]